METKELEKYLNEVSKLLDYEITNILEANRKVATGKLINSIDTKVSNMVTPKGNKLSIDVSYVDYGKYVLSGRKPGKYPNIEAIKNWLMIKNPKYKASNMEYELDQATFLVSRAIKENDIKALNFLKPVDDIQKNKKIMRGIDEAIIKDLQNEIKKRLDNGNTNTK